MVKIRRRYDVVSWLILAIVVSTAVAARGQSQPVGFTALPLAPSSRFESPGAKPASPPSGQAADSASGSTLVSVMVKLEDDSLAAYRGGVAGLAATSPAVTGETRLDAKRPASRAYLGHLARKQAAFEATLATAIPAARIVYRFQTVFGGVSVLVPPSEMHRLATLPGVKTVYRDELLHLHTTRSPEFIGATKLWTALGGQANAGLGVIVGVLDTGIWPEHPSFSDPDPLGHSYPPPPAKWSGTTCRFSGGAHPGAPFSCNNKLIGAYRFMATYEANNSLLPGEFTTARDDDGHGTHTSSTAAGNGGVAASIFGIPRGIASGIAPRAHVVMYRVCGEQGCYDSDSVAAIDQAVTDGVDVINFSISGGADPYNDPVELAFLDAYTAGVFVAASAGNSGPALETTSHRGPWVTTVAASNEDRFFTSDITLSDSDSDTLMLMGASLTEGLSAAKSVVNAADFGDALCLNATPDGAFNDKIVICERGSNARVAKSYNVAQRAAVGMVLYNPSLQGLATDNFFVPGLHLEVDAGSALLAFLSGHTGVTATLMEGMATAVPGDVMAPFSSRGGPGQTLGVSKPDVTAPGVQILAGHTPEPATIDGGRPGELFQAIQGTSMSSPHVAGAAALLKRMHPRWTPGQIKSALMTTAKIAVVKETPDTLAAADADAVLPADAFDCGSGRINLGHARNAFLTLDVPASDYVAHPDDLWSVNYPSLYVPVMPGKITVQRTVHSDLLTASQWAVEVSAPPDITVKVPKNLWVPAKGDTTFRIRVSAPTLPIGAVRHAMLTLRGPAILHMPITIVREQPDVTLNKTCTPATFAQGNTTDCTITISNTSLDDATVSLKDTLPAPLALVSGSVVGATETGNGLTFDGTLLGVQPPTVMIGPDSSPAGYLPLSGFSVPPITGVGDETITNFIVIPPVLYGGETYDRIGMVSNGYLVLGGGTTADVAFNNQTLPNPAPPNNVLAPFWTDLNPAAGGALRAALVTNATQTWLVFDWEAVPNYGGGAPNSFQVWIGMNGVEDISFTYGTVSAGSGGLLTVGAENKYGNSGENVYVNGTGTLPVAGTQLRVTTIPGTPGETHVITFTARGAAAGEWTNCAKMAGDIFFGTNIACTSGQVTP